MRVDRLFLARVPKDNDRVLLHRSGRKGGQDEERGRRGEERTELQVSPS